MNRSIFFVKLSGCVCVVLTAGKGRWAGGGKGGEHQQKRNYLKFRFGMTKFHKKKLPKFHILLVIFVTKGPRPGEFWAG